MPPMPSQSAGKLELRVAGKHQIATDVVTLILEDPRGHPLPAYTAGSHIDIVIPTPEGTLTRQYSLCGDPADSSRYTVAIALAVDSRGGSRHIHQTLQPGDIVITSTPRNHFALDADNTPAVLIAGGIGITPLLAMARELAAAGRPWTLYYCVREPSRAAFLSDLQQIPGGVVVPVFDAMPGIARLDLDAVAKAHLATEAHFYCCGPEPLLQAFEQACRCAPAERVHLERFAASTEALAAQAADADCFTVHLARSGKTLQVPADKSILDTLLADGIDVDYSCTDGICGSCETRVLAGVPLHRDSVLSATEQASHRCMMICVSRATTPSITLDL